MSVIIKDMNMPKFCEDCKIFSGEGYLCPLLENTVNGWVHKVMHERVEECPLVSLPQKHGRLIDMDRLMAVLASTTQITQSDVDLFGHILSLIEHQPVIIEAENGK